MYQFLDNLPSKGSSFDTNWPAWLYLLVNLVIFGAIIFSQIYRYRHLSTPVQLQQTKWVVLGLTAAGIFYIGLLIISLLISSLANTLFLGVVWSFLFPIVLLLIPLSIVPIAASMMPPKPWPPLVPPFAMRSTSRN